MIDLQQNILSKCIPITETGCWIWIGATRTSGYGNIGWKGKTLGAHRASYIAFNGILPEGLQINHKCDVRSCVNPSHLYVGTQKDNMGDMDARNRRVTTSKSGVLNPMYGKTHSSITRQKQSKAKDGKYIGCKHPRATITDDTAKFILGMKGKKTAKQLSIDLDVSFHVIRNIWAKKNWAHINV